VSRKTDPAWKGQWRCAVHEAGKGWTAEVALPLATLTEAGMQLNRLQLNCMSQNLTQAGLEAVFLTDPYYGVKFRNCVAFMPLVAAPAAPSPERSFTVRLHFAETAAAKAGQRVFDVLLQGKPVLRDYEVLGKAGGPNAAVVEEFTGIKATDQVVVGLVPKTTSVEPEAQPEICAIELVQETGK